MEYGEWENKMENIGCSRCRVERGFGTVAAECPAGPPGSIVWMLRDKDYNGNENWEWFVICD